MRLTRFLHGLAWLAAVAAVPSSLENSVVPYGYARNGTYYGISVPGLTQDLFLGIPYAQPPVGDLRFRHPKSLNSTFTELRNATEIGYTCPGWDNTTLYTLNEDCLNLNIVRPSSVYPATGLPIVVQLYAGAGQMGSAANPNANLTWLVQRSVKMGQPIMGIALNFRKGAFGFLTSRDVQNAGELNAGIRDVRMALDWIQENIQGFGGNPDEVTLMGQSSGADMVAWQMFAYGGEGKPPFRAAIQNSGSSNGIASNSTDWYQPMYDQLVSSVNCTESSDRLDCLRKAPYDALAAQNIKSFFFATVDGNFIPVAGGRAKQLGKFHKVPLMLGGGRDEGTGFGIEGCNTEEDIISHGLLYGSGYPMSNATWKKVFELYPDDPAEGLPAGTGSERFASHGYMYKRQSVISGDVTWNSNARQDARVFSVAGVPVYKFVFATPSWSSPTTPPAAYLGASHVANWPFTFNLPGNDTDPWIGPGEARARLRTMASSMTVAFIASLNPNNHGQQFINWPQYSARDAGVNFVFHANGSYLEDDDFRKEAIDYLIETQADRGQ
ncbi:alpha/beta-hydrolase [Penicillium taxi]|uniref:alpha/beta-hydrolase n=1 Tax=Penicillium taxi TaxID=168475 RepID=UPI0025456C88|nr:alpha/beta-hydrolase [Penicillium taxi]KAJ5889070.1 alpha/beta-hydrolase [Penicillium taxi]